MSTDFAPKRPLVQAALRHTPAARVAVGDGSREPFPPPEGAASRGGVWVYGDLRIPGVSNRNGSVRCDQDPRIQCQVSQKDEQGGIAASYFVISLTKNNTKYANLGNNVVLVDFGW